jgi:hypothetical protein
MRSRRVALKQMVERHLNSNASIAVTRTEVHICRLDDEVK